MNVFRAIGWIILSTLIFFVLFIVLQWITHELLLINRITHNILVVVVVGLASYALPKYYGVIGSSLVALFWFCLMIFSHNLSYEHITISVIMLLGGTAGMLLKKRRHIFFIASILVTVVILVAAYFKYSTIEIVSVSSDDRLSIDLVNESNEEVKNMFGEKLFLSRDSVYLINFSFYACLPCRKKKKTMKELEEKFKNKPFRLINIHSFESKKMYLDYYKDEPETYHDSEQLLQKKFKINGAPFELLFDKSGYEVRRMEGFDAEYSQDYLNKTINEISKFLKR